MPKNRVLITKGAACQHRTPPDRLSRLIGTAAAPTLIDVRIDEDFSADPRLIPGAVRRSHLDVQDWASRLMAQSVVVICHKGKKLSEGAAAWLRCGRVAAEILAHVLRRPRAVERRFPALRRVLPMVPRRDQRDAHLADQQGQVRPEAGRLLGRGQPGDQTCEHRRFIGQRSSFRLLQGSPPPTP